MLQKRSDEKCIIPSFRLAAGSVGASRRAVFPRGLSAISSPALRLLKPKHWLLIKRNFDDFLRGGISESDTHTPDHRR